ncbi:MAG: LysR family transcriptional regulator [Pseudomonadota bacterium]
MFDWDDLRVFHALVSAGSMNKAARRLSIGQPTVSRRLEALETRIGARLVTRGADGVELTDVGERIWTLVQTMQNTADDIGRLAHQADKAEVGTVRIAAPDGLAAHWLGRHLPGFVEANPRIRLEIMTKLETESEQIASADILLQTEETKKMHLVAGELASLHYVPFTSRAYLDTYGAPEGLADVLNHRLTDLVSYRHQRDDWPDEAQAIKQMMKPSLTTDSSAVLFEALRSGSTIAMAPTYAACLDEQLVHLDLDLRVTLKLWMVYHPDLRRVTRVRKVLEWLREIFDSARYPWFRKDYVAPADFSKVRTVHIRGEHPKPRLV